MLGKSDQVETNPCLDPGLYIDMDQPLSCSGQITSWDLCYYSPNIVFYGTSVPVELQVWRFDDALAQAEKVVGYRYNVSIPQLPPRFQCISIELNRDEYMNVMAGDLVGVWLYQNTFIPVVKHTKDFRHLLFSPPETFNGAVPTVVRIPTAINEVYYSIQGFAIHLTANVAAATLSGELLYLDCISGGPI